MTFSLTSKAFPHGRTVPTKYTCDGLNVSPPFAWTGLPDGTRSLMFACLDPDAPGGTFITGWLTTCRLT